MTENLLNKKIDNQHYESEAQVDYSFLHLNDWRAPITMIRSILPFKFNVMLCTLVMLLQPISGFSRNLEVYRSQQKPSFTLPDLKGSIHSSSDYYGKVILVNFWASWCPPCIHEMPSLIKLQKQMSDKPFKIITINVGEKKYKVRKFAKLINLNLPVLLDTSEDTYDAWGNETLPTSFLIDTQGNMRYRVRGNPGWQGKESITIIEQLISEKIPAP